MLFDCFNAKCKNIAASSLKVGYESMSAIHFQTTSKDKLPHLSYISVIQRHWVQSSRQLPVLLQGACYSLRSIGKKGMNHSKYQKDLEKIQLVLR